MSRIIAKQIIKFLIFFGTAALIVHILAVGVVYIYSFIGHKYFTYGKGLILRLRRV